MLRFNIEHKEHLMTEFQIPLPGFARSFGNLTQQKKAFIEYFSLIDVECLKLQQLTQFLTGL